jgi:hypothetical protein
MCRNYALRKALDSPLKAAEDNNSGVEMVLRQAKKPLLPFSKANLKSLQTLAQYQIFLIRLWM